MLIEDSQEKLAHIAMKNLRSYPHFMARPLSLCFAFEKAHTQFIAASILELGLTLDSALVTPSEPLLSNIRLQWWLDTFQSSKSKSVPLVKCLKDGFIYYPELREIIIKLIKKWQDINRNKNLNSRFAWDLLWRLIGEMLSVDPEKAVMVGQFVMQRDPTVNSDYIKKNLSSLQNGLKLSRTSQCIMSRWLYLLLCLGFYRRKRNIITEQNPNSPLLGWHILLWRAGVSPRLN